MYFVLLFFVVCCVKAQDPAPSWLAYAKTHCSGQVTRVSATTIVPAKPKNGGAYTSWWFGIEDSTNTNLIQPIIPAWAQCGDSNNYCVFNEQYRWNGSVNWDGKQVGVQPGDKIFAAVQLLSNGTYEMTIRVRGSINTTITELRPPSVLEGMNFTNVYFVVEHHSACNTFPPSNAMIYSNIQVFCNGNYVLNPQWTTAPGANPICKAAAVVKSPSTIALTWQSNAATLVKAAKSKPLHN